MERLKLLVFDLDGTLIDSAQDFCNSVNAALGAVRPRPAARPGDRQLCRQRRAHADAPLACHGRWHGPRQVDENLLAQAYAFFLKYYREHKLDFTYAYEGVLEALAALKELHDAPGRTPRTMAVLTNKPVRPARGICEGLGLADYFLHIYGGDSFPVKKPDPARPALADGRDRRNARRDRDDRRQQGGRETARNAGAWSLGCAFGFGPQNLMDTPPDVLVDSAAEWTAALQSPP